MRSDDNNNNKNNNNNINTFTAHPRSLYSVMSTYGTRQHNTKFNNKYTNYNKLYKGLCSGGREVFLKQKGLEMSFKRGKEGQSRGD